MPDVDFASLNPATVVADMIVNPRDTKFLSLAHDRGCRTTDSHGMQVNQAIAGIAFRTGVKVDGKVMRRTLAEIFG